MTQTKPQIVECADIRDNSEISFYDGPEKAGCSECCWICGRPLRDGAKSTRYIQTWCGAQAVVGDYEPTPEQIENGSDSGFFAVGPTCAKAARAEGVKTLTAAKLAARGIPVD